jgi:hypothetical protein
MGREGSTIRNLQHSVMDAALAIFGNKSAGGLTADEKQKRVDELLRLLSNHWVNTVSRYTDCKLTKATDRLIAVSSIARELSNSGMVKSWRYLAGMWDKNLVFQLVWITVEGRTTPRRKTLGEEGYVALSWSWASIEAPVQPRQILPESAGTTLFALADYVDADVALETDFEFGFVRAAWLMMSGHARRVSGHARRVREVKDIYRYGRQNLSLVDDATGEELWFCSDTVEGWELCRSGTSLATGLVWVPITLEFRSDMLSGSALVLLEVKGKGEEFAQPGEKVYLRLGTGNFGRVPHMLLQDKLLLETGEYQDAA